LKYSFEMGMLVLDVETRFDTVRDARA